MTNKDEAGQTIDLRRRRIANEWDFAVALVKENPQMLTGLKHEQDHFSLTLLETPALVQVDSGVSVRHEHRVRLEFPRYYPTLPIEAYVSEPVVHPNVHPENGFVCLWDRSSQGDTVVEAVAQLRRVLTWTLVNASPEHLMQPDIADRFRKGELPIELPLPHRQLVKPHVWRELRNIKPVRRRPRLTPA